MALLLSGLNIISSVCVCLDYSVLFCMNLEYRGSNFDDRNGQRLIATSIMKMMGNERTNFDIFCFVLNLITITCIFCLIQNPIDMTLDLCKHWQIVIISVGWFIR